MTLQNRLLEHGIERGGIFQAHHLDDQLETILLKLVRGSYISNLSPVIACYDVISTVIVRIYFGLYR